MWNMLVVEDEPIVRVGLRFLVDWESYGVVWKAEASNGEEALKIVEEQDIHIVMTDIRMPVMDGIQLAKRIKEKHAHIQVVVISSYDDFPYVQEALRLGAADYLHKPTMEREEIVAMLRNVLSSLEKSLGASATSQSPTEKERGEFLMSALAGEEEPGKLLAAWDGFGLPDIGKGIRLVGIRLAPPAGEKTDDQRADGSRFVAAKYFVEDYVSLDWGGVVAIGRQNELAWLAPDTPKNEQREWSEYLAELKRNLGNLLNVTLTFSGGMRVTDIGQLRGAYAELIRGFEDRESPVSQAVRIVKEYVDLHFREDLSLSGCAEIAHVSPAHLSRIFLKETGVNFSDYVIRKKMEYAKELLRQTNLRIYEVAAKAGYTHSHYFSKLFKEYAGQSPIDYRNGS